VLKTVEKLERAFDGLGMRFRIGGDSIRIEAGSDFFDLKGAPARVGRAREILYTLLESLESSLVVSGVPCCFMPDAHERLQNARRPGVDYRRPAFCGGCRVRKACPGIPLKRKSKAGDELLAAWFAPISRALDEVAVEVTGHCNLSCGICLIVNTRKTSPPPEDVRRVIDDAKSAGAGTVRFTGGEPLLRKDIFDLTEYAKNAGMTVYLNTNGSLMNERMIARMERSVDSVLVSVQGHDPESEQRLTGGGELFLSKLANLKKLAGSKVPVVRVDTIMSKTLLRHANRYVGMLRAAGVRHWVLTRPMHRTGLAASEEYRLSRAEFLRTLKFILGLRKKGFETYVGNAVPFCVEKGARYDVLFAANSLTEARRLVYDCRGFYKPTYEMNTDLGKSLSEAQRHPFLERLWSLEQLPKPCSACVELKNCLGGNRFMAREAFGDESSPDPLMGAPIRPDRCNKISLS
jgi:MoaA/NifB/PqqE/SkfB family radical SAM enzyme